MTNELHHFKCWIHFTSKDSDVKGTAIAYVKAADHKDAYDKAQGVARVHSVLKTSTLGEISTQKLKHPPKHLRGEK